MTDLGKLLMVAGAGLAVLGAALWGVGRLGFRGSPGDVRYQGPHVRVYFPVVTCLLMSILLSAVLWLWRWWSRR